MKKVLSIAAAISAVFMIPSVHGGGDDIPASQDVDSTFPCPGGGEIHTQGSWNAVTGEVDIATAISRCTLNNGTTVDGSGQTAGTLKPSGNIMEGEVTSFEADLVSEVDVSKTDTQGNPRGEISIHRETRGTYDLTDHSLHGTVTTIRSGESVSLPLAELFIPGSRGDLSSEVRDDLSHSHDGGFSENDADPAPPRSEPGVDEVSRHSVSRGRPVPSAPHLEPEDDTFIYAE